MKVLIADDDQISSRMLQSSLQRQGHEVKVVSNGLDAVSALLEPDAPRLAILDWVMPGADGLTVCRTIRERSPSYVYVIVLTSKGGKEDIAVAFDAEVDDFLTKPFEPVELRARLRSGQRVLELQEKLLETQAQLRMEATHDHLTGLWNRGRVHEQIADELRRAARAAEPVSVLMVDVDHFKAINDRHGHAAGDQVLRAIAGRMRSVLRPHDGLSRYGGEEFLILLGGADEQGAREVAERIRAEVADTPVASDDLSLGITVSLGLATTRGTTDVDTLIAAADAALYRAKAAGRNRVEH